jgi:anti-sigma-K factor RskA
MSEVEPDDPEGEDLAAGEYVLGVLDADARAEVEARMIAEPRFARDVEYWELRLYPLTDSIQSVEPPAALWPRILKSLGPESAKVIDLAQRRAVVFWRNWAVGASAAAAAALVVLAIRPPPPQPSAPAPVAVVQPILVAELADSKGRGFITATYDPNQGVLHASPNLSLPVADGRSPELWLIPADGVPRSLGVIDMAHPTTVKVAGPLRAGASPQAVLAITLEQEGGSPDGKPHAKPVWAGKLGAA